MNMLIIDEKNLSEVENHNQVIRVLHFLIVTTDNKFYYMKNSFAGNIGIRYDISEFDNHIYAINNYRDSIKGLNKIFES